MARRLVAFGRPPPPDDPAYQQWIADFVAQMKAGARSEVCPVCGETRLPGRDHCPACGAPFADDEEE